MEYDPVKRSLGNVFNKTPFLRKVFYKLLDLLLLRAWYIKREIKKEYKNKRNSEVKVFDAGAGFGQYSYFVSSYLERAQVIAVDVKTEQVEDCNDFFEKIGRADRVKFEYGDLTKYVKLDNFDMAMAIDVMEHILEDELVFKNICDSLHKGGCLLISTPSDKGGSDVHHEGEHSFIDEHVRDGYNIDDIERKLKNAGFSNVEKRYSYGVPGSIAWRISMKWPIQLLNISKLFFILLVPYYIILYPLAFLLDWIDVSTNHKSGTGLIVKAVK